MKNIFNPVKVFMDACDQTEIGIGNQSDLYFSLITEELIHELLKEYDKKNIIGIADGIADSVWVISGFAISLGINYKEMEEKLSKRESQNPALLREIFIIDDILEDYKDLRYLYFNHKKYNELYVNNYSEVFCSSLISSLGDLCRAMNIPFDEIYEEVTRSNMSKISENGKVLKNEAGKVQKPATYSPPDLETIIRKKGLL